MHCYALVLQIDLIQPISEKGLIKRNLNGQTAHIFTHKINENQCPFSVTNSMETIEKESWKQKLR